ncbi:hypothetical protein MXD59_19960 [Frankia sp. Ag45/Mut15]|uniref:Uncharacterized protein n=1 Tax=Frankia umida TaxID=573489 RepID=A0ABT0K2N3_9ACTN|nr:hypothetical protein [Frankia umida]MCK9878020.1 hypothetical protein [Frankia umida]
MPPTWTRSPPGWPNPRFDRVPEPVLAGTIVNMDGYDELTYVRDLGLLRA